MMLILSVLFITGCGGGGSDEAWLFYSQMNQAVPENPEDPVNPASPVVVPGACTETGPKVTSSNPTNNDEGVSRGKAITVTFSEAMDPTTIVVTDSANPESLAFTLRDNNGAYVRGTVAMSMSNMVATFTPDELLNADIWYTAIITKYAKNAGGTSLGCTYQWEFKTGTATAAGQAPVFLGATQPYGVLAGEAITCGGGPNSTTGFRVDGDIGVSPGSTFTGCDNTTVTGTIVDTPTAAIAQLALTAAYDDALGRATNVCTLASDDLTIGPPAGCSSGAGGTFFPGLFLSGTTLTIPVDGTITLDAQGDASAVFIFHSESAMTTQTNSHVLLINGAQAKNVYWVLVSSGTIGGTTSDFAGTIIALTSITVNEGTVMVGRTLARNGAVTVQDNALITVPAP
ncbi:MAG: ice-binding family protein [Smithellaceae bacterium]